MGDQIEKPQLLNTNKQADHQKLLANPKQAHAEYKEITSKAKELVCQTADGYYCQVIEMANGLAKASAENAVQKTPEVIQAAKIGRQIGGIFGNDGAEVGNNLMALRQSLIVNVDNFKSESWALNWKLTPARWAFEQAELMGKNGITSVLKEDWNNTVKAATGIVAATTHLNARDLGKGLAVVSTFVASPPLARLMKWQQLNQVRSALKTSEIGRIASSLGKEVQMVESSKKAESLASASHAVAHSEVPPLASTANKEIVAPVGNQQSSALEHTNPSLEHTNPALEHTAPQGTVRTNEGELSKAQYDAARKQLAHLDHPLAPEIEPAKFWRTKMANGKEMMLIPIDGVENSKRIKQLFDCDASHYLFQNQSHLDLIEHNGQRFYALTGPAEHLNNFESTIKNLLPDTKAAQDYLDTHREMMQSLAHDSFGIEPPADSPLKFWRYKAEGGLQRMVIPANAETQAIILKEFSESAGLKNTTIVLKHSNGQEYFELVAPKVAGDNFEKQLAQHPQLAKQLMQTQEAMDKKISLIMQEYREKAAPERQVKTPELVLQAH